MNQRGQSCRLVIPNYAGSRLRNQRGQSGKLVIPNYTGRRLMYQRGQTCKFVIPNYAARRVRNQEDHLLLYFEATPWRGEKSESHIRGNYKK
jgi:hypothetical protein